MPATPGQLARFLLDNPNVLAAYNDQHEGREVVRVLLHNQGDPMYPLETRALGQLPILRQTTPELRSLICAPDLAPADTSHTACQNEPIQLGTQLQPKAAPWVGTAGLPVKWRDPDQTLHWGILSNWHVMVLQPGQVGHTQHQPDDRHPACARLAKWADVSPTEPNTIDAALADALIEGYHTISPQILDVGTPAPNPINAVVGRQVIKSGRTTGLTNGHCTAIGAAVRVSYGDFTATFYDQDLYEADDGPFSAAGDSGSAILDRASKRPCSLLFAGNDELTVANPVRFIVEAFDLQFPFA